MKLFSNYFFICILIVTSSCSDSDGNESKKLKGNVKSYIIKNYVPEEKFGEIIKIISTPIPTETIFDKKGNIVEVNQYKLEILSWKTKFKYNDKNYLKEKTGYDADGNIRSTFKISYNESNDTLEITDSFIYTYTQKFLYNNKGLNDKQEEYAASGELISTQILRYDKQNNLIEKSRYDNKKLLHKFQFEYDDSRNIIKRLGYNQENLVWKNGYEYDASGKETKVFFYKKDGAIETTIENMYEYDDIGNWIKKTQYANEVLDFITEREITYFK